MGAVQGHTKGQSYQFTMTRPAFLAGLNDAHMGVFIPAPWEPKKGSLNYERGWHFGRALQRMGRKLPKKVTNVNHEVTPIYLSIYRNLRQQGEIL